MKSHAFLACFKTYELDFLIKEMLYADLALE